MIFLTVGSHEPFDRLVEAMDSLAGAAALPRIYGQITPRAEYLPRHFEHVAELDPDAYRKACEEAQCLVAHAGMGSIITAMEYGKPIVVLPRRARFDETRNDHQFATARRLAEKPGIFVAYETSELSGALEAALAWKRDAGETGFSPFAETRLIAFLRDQLDAAAG